MICPKGHSMYVESRFCFDHEASDSARDSESLRMFEAMGIELGAEVTLWHCERCDFASAEFHYEEAHS